ncbi:MAG: hypothetical protein V5A43_00595 [Haloarculaceae archaeon]
MRPSRSSRRDLLRAASGLAGLVAAGGLSGCSLVGGRDLPRRSDPAILNHVPERSVAAAHLDASALFEDEALVGAIDSRLGLLAAAEDRVPETTDAAIARVADETGLDPRELEDVLGIVIRPPPEADTGEDGGRLDPLAQTYQAMLVRSGWAPAAVATLLDRRADSVRTSQYRGYEVLTGVREDEPFLSIGVRAGGEYVVGRRPGVEAVIDVAAGDAAALDGQLATALAAARPGPARVAVAPRLDADRASGFGDPVALLAGKVDLAYGSLYADGDRRGTEIVLESGSGFDAEDVHESAESVLVLARAGQILPGLEPILRRVEATRSDSTVTLRYEAPVGDVATTLLSVIAGLILEERS